MRTPVITLLTDFGLRDEYVGVMKGVILSICPAARPVDLSHEIPPGDVRSAGWMLSWAWRYFPIGTVHVAVVDPGVGSSRRILCLEREGHLFLAPDNGLLSPLLQGLRRPDLRAVTERRYGLKPVSRTFHGRDLFAPAAAHLAAGLPPVRLGSRVRRCLRWTPPRVSRTAGRFRGEVLAVDRFGNVVTNVPGAALRRVGCRRLRVEAKGHRVLGPLGSYSAAAPGQPLAIVGSRGLLEISVRDGSAAEVLGLKAGDRIEVRAGR